MSQISQHISILRRRIIALHRIRAVAFSVATTCLFVAACATIDYFVHWPIAARFIILFAAIIAAQKIFKHWLQPLWNQTPTQTSVAIRIEEVEPSLRGVLASAIDFESSSTQTSNPLAISVVERATLAWKKVQPNKHIRRLPAIYATCTTFVMVGMWLLSFYISEKYTSIGLVRTMVPWSQTEWPPQLLIHPEISITHVAKGETIMLRARADENQETHKINTTRVSAVCETQSKNGTIVKKTYEMVSQTDGSWEKPIVAEGESMTFVFFTNDTRTEPVQIQIVEPPTVETAELLIQPPQYAQGLRDPVQVNWNGGVMPTLPAVLAGGTANLRVKLSVPIQPPQDGLGQINTDWLKKTITAVDIANNEPIQTPQFTAETPTQWNLSWTMQNGIDIVVDPSDTNGIHGLQPLRSRIQIVVDQEPTVVVSDPEQDEVVTNKAILSTLIEARDDLALVSIGMRVDRQQRSGEPTPKSILKKEVVVGLVESELRDSMDLSTMDVKSGDTLLLRGMAQDQFETEGKKRQAVLSEPRRIRIVDQDVFEQNIRQQTNILRQSVARLETSQKETIEEKEITNLIQSQKGISDRIDQAQKTAERLAKRLVKNGMKDSAITEALQEVDQRATNASTHSQGASRELQLIASKNKKDCGDAKKEQEETLQAIQSILDVLDRDDDAAGAQRRTDKLAQEISKLRKELQETASKTAGRTAEELSTGEKEQLQKRAQAQRTAAQEAGALVEDLLDRAQRNQKKDPVQAQSLRAAAEEGERGDAAKQLEESADRSEKNQTGAADDSMQAAAETIEKIQKALKADRKAKAEDLKRRLSSLVETIKGLVAHAEASRTEIDSLLNANADLQLNAEKNAERLARNTAATIEESKGGGRATEQVTKILERASDLENNVVNALRSTPIQIDSAKDASSRGLEILKQALSKAKEVKEKQQEEQSERDRENLAKKYLDYAKLQKTLREEVAALIPPDQKELDRRSAVASREFAQRQKTLREQVSNVPKESETIKDTPVFMRTHEFIDQWMATAQEQLTQTQPTPETILELDFSAEALTALATALMDPEQKEDPFAQENSGGGEGESGSGPGEQKKKIPPLSELRLVRELQAQINRRTKTIEDAGANSPGAEKAIRDLSKLQDSVRVLGEEWVEKMKKVSGETPTNPNDSKDKQTSTSGFNFPIKYNFNEYHKKTFNQDNNPTTNKTQAPKNQPLNQTNQPVVTPPKTLDELLGISGSGGEKAAQAQRNEKLERGLNETSLNDLADAAIQDMKLAQQLVSQDRDLGMGTQRVQAQALSRLDALIEAAVKFEKSPSNKSSKSKPQKKNSNSQSGSQKKQDGETKNEGEKQSPKNGDTKQNKEGSQIPGQQSGDKVNPPEFEDAQLQADVEMDEGRSEWGHLPLRIREIMSQGRRDRISALYQRATEAYYRRMAEDRSP